MKTSDSDSKEFPVCRGLDIGYGNTKFTIGYDPEKKEPICRSFPSLAGRGSNANLVSHMGSRAYVEVQVGEKQFCVGPDVRLMMPPNSGMKMHGEFALTDEYMALALGAFHYMNVPKIDYLVVGLPVNNVRNLSERVKARMTGKHNVAGKTIEVVNCEVVAQPIGGLWDHELRNRSLGDMKRMTYLLVDVGWFTTDWLVLRKQQIVGSRSDAANNMGMGAVVRAVGASLCSALSERTGRVIESSEEILERVDGAIQGDGKVMVRGQLEDLTRHMRAGEVSLTEAISKILGSVGSTSDIDRVLVMGGGAHVFAKEICKQLGDDVSAIAYEPMYANARGFHIIASRIGLAEQQKLQTA